MRNAIVRDELRLYYQPIYNIASRTIVGFEALLRWQHPQRSLLSPAVFLATAEESGIIRDIGRWVLRESCKQLRVWHDQFPGLCLYMNANASAVELRHPAYASYVRDMLSAARRNPQHLQIEVTESFFASARRGGRGIGQPAQTRGTDSARRFWHRYSSLSYLERYEFDSLKID